MITSYAAKPGDLNPVDFTYEVVSKDNKGKAQKDN